MSRSVVVPVFPGVQLVDFVGPLDVFDAASRLAGHSLYDPTVTSVGGGSVPSGAGLTLETTAMRELNQRSIDLLLVPGSLDVASMLVDADHIAAVDKLAARSSRVASVCTGAFILGELGWLDGRAATTHWAFASQLSGRYPTTQVAADRLFVEDGEVLTCGGAASGIDLALNLIEMDHGRELARDTAKWLVIYLQRPGLQSQFGVQSSAPSAHQPSVQRAIDAIVAAPERSHSVAELAAAVGVSRRHFARLFREGTGDTPAKFVEATRVGLAKTLLETTDTGHESIALQCGFSSAELLRQTFRRHYGLSPAQHRATFGSRPIDAG